VIVPVLVRLFDEDWREITRVADAGAMSDHTSIRPEPRTSLIARNDMRIGLAGEYALCRWLHGDVHAWIQQREELITYGHHDGGCDCPGYRVDVKCSSRRFGIRPEHHHLIVEKRVIKRDWVYVLALLDGDEVLLMGYEDSVGLRAEQSRRNGGVMVWRVDEEVDGEWHRGEQQVSVWRRATKLKQLPAPEEAREQWSIAK